MGWPAQLRRKLPGAAWIIALTATVSLALNLNHWVTPPAIQEVVAKAKMEVTKTLTERHDHALKDTKKVHESAIAELKASYAKALRAQVAKAIESEKAAVVEVEQALQAMKKSHKAEIAKLKASHAEALRAQVAKATESEKAAVVEAAQALQAMKKSHKAEIAKLKVSHAEALQVQVETAKAEKAKTVAAARREVVIGLITKTETNPFFVKMKEGAEEQAQKSGAKLLSASGKIDGDTASQITAMENMAAAGAKTILLTSSGDAVIPTVKRLQKQGVQVIALDSPFNGADALFATDNYQAGVLIGEYAKAAMGAKNR